MVRIVLSVLLAATGISVAACGQSEAEKERQARLASLSPQARGVQDVLDKRCVKCHTPPDAKKNLDLTEPHYLLPLINSEFIFDDTRLYNMLMGPDTIKEHAPPEFQLKQDEIDMIRRWVLTEHPEYGAPRTSAPSTSLRPSLGSDGNAG